MAGKTNTDQLLMDQIVDTVNDLINEMIKPVFEKDEARKVHVDNIVYIIDHDTKTEKVPQLYPY